MKRLALLALMTAFLANALVVSAWAGSCMHDMTVKIAAPAPEPAPQTGMTDMPCHDQSPEGACPDCGDTCLCLHVSINQTPVTAESPALPRPAAIDENTIKPQPALKALQTVPPRRPPRVIS